MKSMDDKEPDKLAFEPPEPQYISSLYTLEIPYNDPHLDDPWKLRIYATKMLDKKIGDETQITDLKVRKPGILKRLIAKILRRTPNTKLFLTVKF